jgi:hypothetical protein
MYINIYVNQMNYEEFAQIACNELLVEGLKDEDIKKICFVHSIFSDVPYLTLFLLILWLSHFSNDFLHHTHVHIFQ